MNGLSDSDSNLIMKVLALVSRKGGSGKTTVAACLAVAAVRAGLRVAAIDIDPQKSLSAWGKRREAKDITHHTATPDRFEDLLTRIREAGATDLVVVDSAGVADTGAALAARLANLTLVPVKPTQLDIDAATETVGTLRGLGAKLAVVLTQVPTGQAIERARDAARVIVKLGKTSPHLVTYRMPYVDAIGLGMGATDHDPKSKAAQEIGELWDWIAKEIDLASA